VTEDLPTLHPSPSLPSLVADRRTTGSRSSRAVKCRCLRRQTRGAEPVVGRRKKSTSCRRSGSAWSSRTSPTDGVLATNDDNAATRRRRRSTRSPRCRDTGAAKSSARRRRLPAMPSWTSYAVCRDGRTDGRSEDRTVSSADRSRSGLVDRSFRLQCRVAQLRIGTSSVCYVLQLYVRACRHVDIANTFDVFRGQKSNRRWLDELDDVIAIVLRRIL